MLRNGAFADVEAAMMVHPGDRDLTKMSTLATGSVVATFHGHASHAAAAPWLGRNALDAAINGYNNISALRQQLAPDQRLHGGFLDVPSRSNVIPERVSMRWVCRGESFTSMRTVLDNAPIYKRFAVNAATLGRAHAEPGPFSGHVFGSTDMGIVSRIVPSIHPVIGVAAPGISIHERAFERAAGSVAGDQAVIDGALAMAMTVVNLWTDASLRSAAWIQLRVDKDADPFRRS
jgi:metal-dependent amidase/aminoacylase/carboxypeptidase family protein